MYLMDLHRYADKTTCLADETKAALPYPGENGAGRCFASPPHFWIYLLLIVVWTACIYLDGLVAGAAANFA